MEYVYTSFVFLLSIVESMLLYYAVCRRKPAIVTGSRLTALLVLYLGMLLSVVCGSDRIFQTIIIAVLYYLVGCIFTKTGWIQNIKYWILSLLLSSALEQMLYLIIWRHIFQSAGGYGPGDVMTCASAALLLVILYKLVGKKEEDVEPYVKKLFIVLTPATTAVIAAISYMAYVLEETDNGEKTQITLSVLLLALLGIVAVIILIVHSQQQKESFRLKAELENQYNLQQRSYFAHLLDKEKETKRFRHDVCNHLICLQQLIKNQRYKDAGAYLEDLLAELQGIREMQYDIGNEIVNVMLNYYLIPVKEKCSIQVEGYLGRLDQISQMDLCTIFSNVIKNAAEVVEKNGRIEIYIARKEKYAQVLIGNSFSQEIVLSDKGELQTGKEDKTHHGFGLENVKRVVGKNHGEFQYSLGENWFEVTIILPT